MDIWLKESIITLILTLRNSYEDDTMIYKQAERDRPTFNTLQYLTKVKPHHIRKDPQIIDQWTKQLLSELLGNDPVQEFGEYTRSFYTLEGHYENFWRYDRKILPRSKDQLLDTAIMHTSRVFRLDKPVTSIRWDSLKDVPFISSSGAGYGYVGRKGSPGNHDLAIKRAVATLYTWDESVCGDGNTIFRFKPDLAWTRTQLGTFERPKIRHVWGSAFENIILEGITAAPLIEAYAGRDHPMVVGVNMYKRLPNVIHKALSNEGHQNIGIGLDFSAFDSSLQPWIMNAAFSILRENIQFSGHYEERSFEFLRYHFIHRPVVMPDGRMWLKHRDFHLVHTLRN